MDYDNIDLVNKLGVIASTLSSINDLETLSNSVHQIVDTIVHVEYTGLYFYDTTKQALRLVHAKGFTAEESKRAESTAMSRHPGWVFKHREVLLISDTEKDKKGQSKDSKRSFKVRSRVWLPILKIDQAIGAFGLASIHPNQFSEEHIALLSFICDLSGVVYNNIKLKEAQITNTKKLKKSEQEFIKLFESNPEAVILHSPSHITHANKAFLELLELPNKEAVINKKDIFSFITEINLSAFKSYLFDTNTARKHLPQVPIRSSSGKLFTAEIYSGFLNIGTQQYSVLTIRDISLKIATEEKLKIEEQKSLLQQQAEQVPGIIFQLKQTKNGKLNYQFIGGKLLDQLGQLDNTTDYKLLDNIHPDDKNRFLSVLNQSKASIKTCSIDYRVVQKNKDICWIRSNSKPVLMPDNSVVWNGYATDITEQVAANEALKASITQISTIFNNAPDAIILIDKHGKINRWNRKAVEVFGWKAEEVLGKYMYDIIPPPDYSPMFKEAISRINKIPDSNILNNTHELYGFTKNKERFPISMSISRMMIQSSLYFICFMNNIDVRKKNEKKIRQSLKEKNVLLKEIHHRVKNNMQVIASLLSLQASFVEKENVRKYFMSSQFRIRSMGMIHEMLYQSENISFILFKDYLSKLTNDLVEALKNKENELEISISCPEISFNIDTAIPLGLILNELISNSLKHGIQQNKAGKIQLIIVPLSAPFYQLEIIDNGIGMQQNKKQKKSLGLMLVRKLVLQLGGTIELLSTSIGCHYKIVFQEVS